jgi:hypothetical protein
MEAALRALLIGYAPLTALVPAARIVWNHLPQATARPAIVLYKIAGAEGLAHDGPDGLASYIVQIDIQSAASATVTKPVDQMWTIRNALVAKLHGYKDATFGLIRHDSERQDSEELAGAGSLIHRSSLDFTVWHKPA